MYYFSKKGRNNIGKIFYERKEFFKMRSLAVYLKNYKKESILAPFFKFLEVVFDLIVPIVIAQIIDVGIANHDNKYIVQRFFILILMAALGLASSITAQFFAAKASVGFATKLRQAVYDHVQHLSFTELDTLGTDTLITRLTDDINQVQNGLNMGLRLLLRSPFIVLGSMVMAFTIDFKCALVFAVAIPFLFLVVFVIMFLSIPLFKKVQGKLDTVTGLTRENLTGVRVIRAFCREKEAVAEFDTRNQELTKLNLFVGKLSALLNPVTYVLINIATVILIQKAGVEVNLGGMQQGQVVALYNYMAQMIVELIKLASLIITLNKSAACAGRVADILKVKSTMDYPSSSTYSAQISKDLATATADASLSENAIVFNDVTFEYSKAGAPSLSHISFSVKKGQTVGIIGGTGSGKTTLVNLISRFYDASKGTVLLDGQNIENYTRSDLRSRIGVVPQKAALFKGSIRDNLKWGREDASDEDLWQALTTAQGKEVVEGKPGQLDFMLEQNGKNLSGGQKQRVGIARAIVSNPSVLLSDEATSALDPETVKSILQLLKDINKKMGITIIMITHQMEVIKEIAEQVAVIEKGKIIEQGSVVDLFTNPQTETLKKFVGSVMSSDVPEQLSHMNISKVKQKDSDQTIVSLKFRGDVANEPIIANLIRKYNLDVSILYGSIDYIQNVSFGRLIIMINGHEEDMKKALGHLQSLPITSEVIGYVPSDN